MPEGALVGLITHASDALPDSQDEISSTIQQAEIRAPITGEILAINENIERDAAVFLSQHPDQSWLYKLKLTEGQVIEGPNWMSPEEYQRYLVSIGWST